MRNGLRLKFLFFHEVTKEPLAVVEVDGYFLQKEGTRQEERDALKDSVLRKIGIPLLWLSTCTEMGGHEAEDLIFRQQGRRTKEKPGNEEMPGFSGCRDDESITAWSCA